MQYKTEHLIKLGANQKYPTSKHETSSNTCQVRAHGHCFLQTLADCEYALPITPFQVGNRFNFVQGTLIRRLFVF